MHCGLTTSSSCGILSVGRKTDTLWREEMTTFKSLTSKEHMKALKEEYPQPKSADKAEFDPDEYCVGGGLCGYILDWHDNDRDLIALQHDIRNMTDTGDGDIDIRFPRNNVLAEALNYIAYVYHGRYVTERLQMEVDKRYHSSIENWLQSFFEWVASGLTHMNDLEHFGWSWDWIESMFRKEELDYKLDQFIAEMNGSPSHIFRTEDW